MNDCKYCEFLKKYEWCQQDCDDKDTWRMRDILKRQENARKSFIKVMLDEGALAPVRAHEDDAGLDIKSPVTAFLPAGKSVFITTGIHVQIPKGYVGLLTSKSGLMMKGITSRGTIDSGYTGPIGVVLFNHGGQDRRINKGDKITQLVLLPIITPEIKVVTELEDTARGDKGFGSTGK